MYEERKEANFEDREVQSKQRPIYHKCKMFSVRGAHRTFLRHNIYSPTLFFWKTLCTFLCIY